jgi:hypothetical protein
MGRKKPVSVVRVLQVLSLLIDCSIKNVNCHLMKVAGGSGDGGQCSSSSSSRVGHGVREDTSLYLSPWVRERERER